MFLQKNKKTKLISFFLVILFGGFFLTTNFVHAGAVGDAFVYGIKVILYALFVGIGALASVAITIFQWSINPDYISGPAPLGFFNSVSVYSLWKFVRDFFNLFFILTLLYIAFTIVFQIAGDYKKTLLSLVLAALFVNFSFPITRFMIDASNVPLYFFANQMTDAKGRPGGGLSSVMSASKIQNILVKGSGDGISNVDFSDTGVGITQLLFAIVFLFIFSVSLVVLSVMFIIRLAALYILLVFSSIGFAASVIPGLNRYASMWWDKFTQYALFGPAAMLMLYVATRFFQEISTNGILQNQIEQEARNNATSGFAGMISGAAQFSIPMVMLWMAIGLANSFSIAGAGAVTGKGKDSINWVRRKMVSGGKWVGLHNPVSNTTRGFAAGAKERASGWKPVSATMDWFKRPSGLEAGAKGLASGKGWAKGRDSAYAKFNEKKLQEKLEEHKKNKTSASALEKDLKEGDAIEKRAAALAMAENKDITSAERLSLALAAVAGDADRFRKVMESAKGAAGGMNSDQIIAATTKRNPDGSLQKDPVTQKVVIDTDALKALTGALKKEGNAKAIVDFEVKQNGKGKREAVAEVMDSIKSAKDLVQQESLFTDKEFGAFAQNHVRSNAARYQEIKKVAIQESPKVAAVI